MAQAQKARKLEIELPAVNAESMESGIRLSFIITIWMVLSHFFNMSY